MCYEGAGFNTLISVVELFTGCGINWNCPKSIVYVKFCYSFMLPVKKSAITWQEFISPKVPQSWFCIQTIWYVLVRILTNLIYSTSDKSIRIMIDSPDANSGFNYFKRSRIAWQWTVSFPWKCSVWSPVGIQSAKIDEAK